MIDFMKLQHGSDIRGVAVESASGEEVTLTEEVAGAIAGSFAYWLGFKAGKNPYDLRISVGQDSRLSSDTLKEGILKGIAMFGAEGYDAGLASSPAMFMSTVMPQLDFDGAVMITGRHLPQDMNGFRFFTPEGSLDAEDIAVILRTASRYNFVGEFYEERDTNARQIYAAYLRQLMSFGLRDVPGGLSGMHIIVDAGNGTGGFFAEEVLGQMGADISGSCFLEPDGHFPGHRPDTRDTDALASLSEAVTGSNADLGIIFDADAGRAAIIGPDGRQIAGNELIALAAALAAEDHPGGTVITDSVTSDELTGFLEGRLGLKHIRYRRGSGNIISKAKELSESDEQVFLAADTSGLAAYSDNFFCDDGIFLAVQVIINAAQAKSEGRDIRSFTEGLGAPASSCEVRFSMTADNRMKTGRAILEDMEKWVRETSGLRLVTPNYEGVRVSFTIPAGEGEASGWFLLRQSRHERGLLLTAESDTPGGAEAVLPVIYDFIGRYEGIGLPQ